MSWRSFAREPLVHFVAIGLVLFGIDAWRAPSREDRAAPAPTATPAAPAVATAPAERKIVVDDKRKAELAERAQRRRGRPPTAAEIGEEIERWIDEEVLYREAIARGLERGDPVIHERIASRMSYVLEQAAIVPEPSEAELRGWFDAHRETWAAPDRLDFVHVFVAGADAAAAATRIDELAKAIAAGAPHESLGDRFSGGRHYRGRRIADLKQTFGDEFVDGLAGQPPGAWSRRRSRYGWHLVRVERVEAARDADFEKARLDVRKMWRDARLAAELAAAVRRLRGSWEIVRP